MTETKKLKFDEFQKMLTEVEGRPVYREEKDRFVLEWTSGGFLYQTEAKFQDIRNSFTTQFPSSGGDAIEFFVQKYLKDCYQEVQSYPTSQDISLIEAFETVREGSTNLPSRSNLRETANIQITEKGGDKIVELIREDGTITARFKLGTFIKSKQA